MAYQIKYAYTSHTGKVRANNEDNFWCCGNYMPAENQGIEGIVEGNKNVLMQPLFAVFDGMGGESCGEMAAYLAAKACGKWKQKHKMHRPKSKEEALSELCREMNEAVCIYARENKIQSMGSTAALLLFDQDGGCACNLGDSSIYEWKEGTLKKVSTDHVLKTNLFGKAPLTQFLGIPEESMILEPSMVPVQLVPGARYLICTDGVTDMLSNRELEQILSSGKSPEMAVQEILNRAIAEGGKDNTTMIVCEITEKRNLFSGWLDKNRKDSSKGAHD
jgi:protein phosphatase